MKKKHTGSIITSKHITFAKHCICINISSMTMIKQLSSVPVIYKYKLMLWCGGPKEIIVLYAQQPRITGTLLVKLQNEFILKRQEAIKSALTILRAVSG